MDTRNAHSEGCEIAAAILIGGILIICLVMHAIHYIGGNNGEYREPVSNTIESTGQGW